MGLVQGDFALALLGAEPESAEQAEEDVHKQERHAGEVVPHFIVLILLEATANILETSDIADKHIADAILALAVCLQSGNEILVVFGTDTDTKFKIASVPINLNDFGNLTSVKPVYLNASLSIIFNFCDILILFNL